MITDILILFTRSIENMVLAYRRTFRPYGFNQKVMYMGWKWREDIERKSSRLQD